MRVTVDDELIREAMRLTDNTSPAAVTQQPLVAFIQRESARRLARLGGSQPHLEVPPRRRADPE